MDQRSTEIGELRAAYAAFNQGDIDSAVKCLDKNVLWMEPAEFPGGGIYRGREEAKRYLSQSRNGAASVVSVPEKFVVSGDRIVVFVHAKVQSKADDTPQDIRLADVYTFRDGRVVEMRAFSDQQEALRWAQAGQ